MGFLIPTARPNPSLLARLGRLLHWTALGLAALMLVPAYFAATQSAPAPVQPTPTRAGQGNPFDRFDAPSTSTDGPWTQYAPRGDSTVAPWANDPIVGQALQTEYGYAVIGPNRPAPGAGAAPGRDTSARTADPWAAFDGVAPSVQQAPVISAALSIRQQGLPYEFWLIAAATFALVGRAARYLFAGE